MGCRYEISESSSDENFADAEVSGYRFRRKEKGTYWKTDQRPMTEVCTKRKAHGKLNLQKGKRTAMLSITCARSGS